MSYEIKGVIIVDDDRNVVSANTYNGYVPVNPTRSILSGNGIVGGGDLSSDKTLYVRAGNGIIANTTGVHVGVGLGISTNATSVSVVAGNSIVSNSTGVHYVGNTNSYQAISIIAGNGLVGGGNLSASRTLTVGQGAGILVAESAISVVAGSGISSNATGVHVVAGSGVASNTTGVHVVAGSGIVSNTSGVHIENSTVARLNVTTPQYFSSAIIANTFMSIKSDAGVENASVVFVNNNNTSSYQLQYQR